MLKTRDRWRGEKQPVKAVIKNFNPQWFLMCMGTGSLAVNLQVLPYQFNGLGVLSEIIFFIDLALWLFFVTMFTLRCIMNGQETIKLFKSDIEATDYISTLSISLSTILEFIAITTYIWSGWDIVLAVFFWIDLAFSLVGSVLPYYLMIRFEHVEVGNLPPTVLYPATGLLSTASLGAVICSYTELSVRASFPIFIISYILLGLGFFLALAVLALLTARLITNQTPSPEKCWTHLVPVAAISNAGYAIVLLGHLAGPDRNLLQSYGKGYSASLGIGTAVYGASLVQGLLFYGFAAFWIILATTIILVDGRKAKLDLNFWSSLYPLGIFALANQQLAYDFNSPTFRTLSTIFVCILLLLWLFGLAWTIPRVISGELLLPAPEEKDDD